ncbi:uncharacterized protein [Erythrolamprus reginae]|uniref:uncharacterized protein isoform X2 n=1 Tax=Erythrolamprus reginae TaxID=121349 RepID=UPI00396C54D2
MANILLFCKKELLLSKTHCLNIESLNKVKNEWENLEMDNGMGKCFEEVMKNFPNEPSWVKENAQMVLKGDDGKELSFASGKKEWKINVSAGDYKFRVKAPSKSAYVARLSFQEQPLSIAHLKKVEEDLKTFGPLTQAEKSFFRLVLQYFCNKTSEIQNNTQIKFTFDMDGENVKYLFTSGNGDYKLDVTHLNEQLQYRELHVSSGNKLEKFSGSLQTLDVDHLREIKNELARLDLLTDSLKSCFSRIVDELPKYSYIIKENLQIDFTCKEQQLYIKSKDWEITAQSNDGKVDFNFNPETWELFLKEDNGKKHELSVEKLVAMRKTLRYLKEVPKHVMNIINKAIAIFSEQISCLQKNAQLIIECDQGEMVFISGKGQNRIDMFCLNDVVQFEISRTRLMGFLRFIWKGLAKILLTALKLIPPSTPFLGLPFH